MPAASGALLHVVNGSDWPLVMLRGQLLPRACFSQAPPPRSSFQGVTQPEQPLPEPCGREGPNKTRVKHQPLSSGGTGD